MIIRVGTENPIKVQAVREVIDDYDFLSDAEVVGIAANSEVGSQPKSLDETVAGAMNRARNVFDECSFGIGLESGLVAVPNTKSGYMDFCACAIYDGKIFHLGFSCGFEYPRHVVEKVFADEIEIDQAVRELGLTPDQRIGKRGGMIGLLTKGRIDRLAMTKQALVTALIHLENRELY